ncbi:MAG: alginate export family protein [Planctomycetota bacterium]|nr:alginate export family protein [Planctomycetota bacterium]
MKRTWITCGLITAILGMLVHPVMGQDEVPIPESQDDQPNEFVDALTGGKVSLNLRVRLETVNQDGKDDSEAVTARIRLGYETKSFHGLSFRIDVEDVRSPWSSEYNAAGLNNQPNKAVVADPEDTALDQLYVKYVWEEINSTFIVGRQRIKLDDDRFIGNVGWRQIEQTYDSARWNVTPIEDLDVVYSYLWKVKRIFGPDADRDWDSDSHIINVAYKGMESCKIVGFAYLLDLDNDDVAPNGDFFSSDTYGMRVSGKHVFNEEYSLAYIGSYAHQEDAGDNPTNYDADYYKIEAALTKKELGTFGAGYEVLGSDDSLMAFQTPLATLHAFNGWADAFLTTPTAGLEDFYIFAKTTLPWDIKGAVYAHWFEAEDGSAEWGEEIDLVLSKKINSNWSILTKFAEFNGKNGFADTTKFWFQTEFTF